MDAKTPHKRFRSKVYARAKASKTFAEALFRTLGEEQSREHESGHRPACRKYCSLCCYQLVDVVPEEIRLIWQYLKKLPPIQKEKWRERLMSAARVWDTYIVTTPRLYLRDHGAILKGFAEDWRGKPCPFLENGGACGIYEVRPLPCRTFTSLLTCRTPDEVYDGKHGGQCRYPSEKWAMEMHIEQRLASDDTLPTAYLIQFVARIDWREL